MKIIPESNLLDEAKIILSPNCDDRPDSSSISLIIIHSISLPPSVFGGSYVEEFFLNKLKKSENDYINNLRNTKVSSHLYIKRTGEIIQFVNFNKRAWHAGKSTFENTSNCNDYSIGIELEGFDDIVYEDIQYEKLSKIIKALLDFYPRISTDRIVGHSDVSPQRKSDPGPLFDWKRLKSML